MDNLSNADMYLVIVGFLMPLLISVLIKSTWPSWARGLFAFVACVVVAAIDIFFISRTFDPNDLVRSILIVFFLAIATYHFWWKPSQITTKVEENVNLY